MTPNCLESAVQAGCGIEGSWSWAYLCPRLADGVLATENDPLTFTGLQFKFPVLFKGSWSWAYLCPRLADGVLATENDPLTFTGLQFKFPVLFRVSTTLACHDSALQEYDAGLENTARESC
jgi:hypothetical protein